MTTSSPPASAVVQINGRPFRCYFDADGGRVWLEDTETRTQSAFRRRSLDFEAVEPSTVAFVAADNEAGPIRVVVTLAIAACTVAHTFVLEPIPVDEAELMRVRMRDMHATLVKVQSRLVALERQTGKLFWAKQVAGARLKRELTAFVGLAALVVVAAALSAWSLLVVPAVVVLCTLCLALSDVGSLVAA